MTKHKKSTEELCEALLQKNVQGFRPGYIRHIRFPKFKNLAAGARIDFDFPLTALIGPNGSGKTSVLHAMYGAPLGKSTGDFWFSTDCDPITEGDGEINRFIYGHVIDSQTIAETRKARVSKDENPDYWEPTKATASDSMDFDSSQRPIKGIRSKDRWNPVKKNVLYLNFRSELSAFDKFMFFDDINQRELVSSKQTFLRKRAKHLKGALNTGNATLSLYGRNRLSLNRVLAQKELECVSEILGRDYTEAKLLIHELYRGKGMSAQFSTTSLKYTEAFAGSGELAIVSLVTKVLSVEPRTLIILDEPEVSLHPGAQGKLIHFLLEQILQHDHQVVLSTHSPFLVQGLPPKAVKSFLSTASGRFDVTNSCHPYAAFNNLGVTPPGKLQIFVEDRLGMAVAMAAIRHLSKNDQSLCVVTFLPGGAEAYWAHRIPTLMLDSSRQSLILFDGDQRKTTGDVRGPDEIAPAELENYVRQLSGCSPVILADGSQGEPNEDKKNDLYKKYLKYVKNHVRYFPATCPEEIFLRLRDPNYVAGSSQEAKSNYRTHFHKIDETLPLEMMDASARIELTAAPTNNDLKKIGEIIMEALKGLGHAQ